MCGIAGILNFASSAGSLRSLQAMNAAMRHRGPDDEGLVGFHRNTTAYEVLRGEDTPPDHARADLRYAPRDSALSADFDALLLLGHRRLAIIDLSANGHQPMCTDDGRYWITYNGEVYNYREIRAELISLGEHFHSATDTEVVLKAYRQWGPQALDRFNGMWAFAIWDNVERRLFCCRDRIGIKPLMYSANERRLVFASDIKTVLASGLIEAEPDFEGLRHSMSLLCPPRPITAFRGIRSLEPAHWMTIDASGRVTEQRYWRPPLQSAGQRTDADWIEGFDALLHQSVRRRLNADVTVGSYMSGGVDSTTLSAIAAQEHPRLSALTMAFESELPEHDEFDESQAAAAAAKRHGMAHVIHAFKADEPLEHLWDVVHAYEEPVFPFSPNYMISKLAAEQGLKVVLCGLGPDELLCGYRRDRLLVRARAMPSVFKPLLRRLPGWRRWLRQTSEAASCVSEADAYLRTWSLFSESQKQAILAPDFLRGEPTHEAIGRLYAPEGTTFKDGVQAACYFDLMSFIGNAHCHQEDQVAMKFSLEARFPYLDHELVELALTMPSRLKVRDGQRKFALRKIAERLIPRECLEGPKKGFSMPMGWWINGPIRQFAKEQLDALTTRGVARQDAIASLWSDAQHNDRAATQVCFLLALEMWFKTFIDAPRPAETKPLRRIPILDPPAASLANSS